MTWIINKNDKNKLKSMSITINVEHILKKCKNAWKVIFSMLQVCVSVHSSLCVCEGSGGVFVGYEGGVYSDTHAYGSQWKIFSSVDSQMSSNRHFETESYLS